MSDTDEAQARRPDWPWKQQPPETYREALQHSVHFSIKGINSNAKALGVRLGPDDARDLPYVCMARSIADGFHFPTDYTMNSPQQKATVFRQIANILEWNGMARHADAPESECAVIEEEAARAFQTRHFEFVPDTPISPRARQVLFPTPDGDYVTLIPLPSAVFAGFLRSRWFEYRDRHTPEEEGFQASPRIKQAYMGFGGSNTQNASRDIRPLQEPFVFAAPQERPRVRRAFAIHYGGVSMRLPPAQMTAYREWRDREMAKGGIAPDIHKRRKEARLVADVVHALLRRGRRARSILEENRHVLPIAEDTDRLVADSVDPVPAGLSDRGSRTAEWPRQFAEATARHIVNYPFRDGRTLGLAESAVRELSHWIEEEVRNHEPV